VVVELFIAGDQEPEILLLDVDGKVKPSPEQIAET
jgi:hypothetical protein